MMLCRDLNTPKNVVDIPKLLPCHQVQKQPIPAETESPCERKEPFSFKISPLKGLQVVTPLCCAV